MEKPNIVEKKINWKTQFLISTPSFCFDFPFRIKIIYFTRLYKIILTVNDLFHIF